MSQPLLGKAVLVTRPDDGQDTLPHALRVAGATVLLAPLVAFEPADAGPLLEALSGPFDAVLLTSPRSARAVAPIMPPGSVVIALAQRTKDEARHLGLNVVNLRDALDGVDLAAAMAEHMPVRGKRFVLPTSNVAQPSIAAVLQSQGAVVDVVVAYHTVPIRKLPGDVMEALTQKRVNAVVCMSPSAVKTLVDLVQTNALQHLVFVVPGLTTAKAAAKHRLRAAIAKNPTPGEVVKAVIRALR
jgi:uroporphyrinogen-III synthase